MAWQSAFGGQRGKPMTKKDMAKEIAQATGITQAQAREIVQRVFNGIIETLVEKGRIELRNFGVFEVKKRKPRQARNPRTGEKVWPNTTPALTQKQAASDVSML